MKAPDRALMMELFHYDADTGFFRHKRVRQGAKHGEIAGTTDRDGYRKIKIVGIYYLSHHCAWFWVHNQWPENEIDHKDRIPGHDWIDNLRPATRSQNKANSTAKTGTACGLKGVTILRYPSGKTRYRAQVTKDGIVTYLGRYDSPEHAHQRYLEEAVKLFGDFASDGKRAA